MVLPILNTKKCTLCGSCIDVCQHDVLAVSGSGLSFSHPEQCTYCGECEAVCPKKAITCPLEIIWAE